MRRSALALALLIACGTGSASETAGSETAASNQATSADAAEKPASNGLCVHMGPQTPRDIASASGLNTEAFPLAPPVSEMNLCNIHTHTNAEHMVPDSASSSAPPTTAASRATRHRT